ncbi:hypothetical protein MHI02_01410 [Oceanobacillus sp. FSL K6-0118]|uniref:Uncharacterized protein n=1 Tax=Oceanobacillus caeni TaxID=405946 RepID=A0ABR5MK17_9BACI|nr:MULTISPECIES: hypothetical protein [Bacillaceae]KPH75760.1 hypothetical protein AFL42_08410 [Oceanobacillus caeni]MBU8791911.1 hypothetical protein [Oceanobacillus caeni]
MINNVITTFIIAYIYFIRAKQIETLIQSGLKQMSNIKDKVIANINIGKMTFIYVNALLSGGGTMELKRYLHLTTDARARGSPYAKI